MYAVNYEKGKMQYDEILYVHLQKRKIRIEQDALKSGAFTIYPNRIKSIANNDILYREIKRIAYIEKIRIFFKIDETVHLFKELKLLWKHIKKIFD